MKKYKIPLSQPDITELERRAVLSVLKTPYLSLGPKLKEFEEKTAKEAGVKYSVAVNSGTSALHLIVRALGLKKGDEVITTPFSFIASSNCILFEGAKPVFVDIEPQTFSINPDEIEKKINQRTKAILAVDVFGHPAKWDEILKVAQKNKLKVIADSAESLGSEYKGRKCGGFGTASIFSFYPNKQVTTGEGGVVLTNDKKIADLFQSMTNQGRRIRGGKWLEHIRLGYNYRLDEMSCALGIVQLERLKGTIKKRERVAQMYGKKLKGVPEVKIPYVAPDVKMSWFVYVIQLSPEFSFKKRDKIIEELEKRGIQSRAYFQSIHLQPFYKKLFSFKRGDFPVCEKVSERVISLPFYNNLKEKQIDFVVNSLKEIIAKLK